MGDHLAPDHLEEKSKHRSDDGTPDSDEGTYVYDSASNGNHLRVDTSYNDLDRTALASPVTAREESTRLEDDLAVMEAERMVSRSTQEAESKKSVHDGRPSTSRSRSRSRSRPNEHVDEFDEATNPLHEKAAVYNPPENPNTNIARFVKRLHESSFIIRYLTYILPLVIILLIPLLVGALAYPNASVGGVRLVWFSVWLEIVWLTLWAGRVSTCDIVVCLPIASLLIRFWTDRLQADPYTCERAR